MTQRTLAKSLHTITALVNVARFVQARGILLDARDAVDYAADILGYRSREHDDPYFLKEKAAATLKAQAAQAAVAATQQVWGKPEVNAALQSQMMANGARGE